MFLLEEMVKRRSQRTVDVVTLRDVLGSLDNAHGDLVYSMLFLRYLETGIFERIDLRKARKCRKLCFCYFKLKRELLPMLADYTCVLLAGLAKNEIAETGKHPIYDEAERMIWRLSMRHVWKIQTTPLAAYINSMYSQSLPTHDMDETTEAVIPLVEETTRLVNAKDYRLAVGNLSVLFRLLHKLYVWHPEMFTGTGQVHSYNLGLMVSMTRKLFCKVRGADGLPADLAEEMDCLAVVRNARYNRFFGEWESEEFKDMVSGYGHQSRDYTLEEDGPAMDMFLKKIY